MPPNPLEDGNTKESDSDIPKRTDAITAQLATTQDITAPMIFPFL
jgi:hypothetical protein